jgi:hypothetical protein
MTATILPFGHETLRALMQYRRRLAEWGINDEFHFESLRYIFWPFRRDDDGGAQ